MENFVVSARKYRPTTFASVVGQRHITSTLKNAIERGQLAHAYLFCGPRGVGKTTCARIFAKAINCLNPVAGEPCNECESCRSFNENRSLNVHELDAASNNSVDDIRNLIEQVRIIPQQGRYSVFVIDEVHMLSAAAFNAFLKTLEEPPHHAIFILATTEKHKIIPTILSRCQIYDFNRIKVEDGVEYLRYIASQEGVEADDEALNLIAHKADGGMRDALSMFDKAVSFCGTKLNYKDVAATLNVLDYDTYFSATDLLVEGRYVNALMLFDEVLSRGFSPQIFIAGLNAHMRDLLLARGPAISLVEFTGSLVERYRAQAAKCDEGFLFNAIALLTEADGRIRQSSNQRLLVELGLMKIAGLGQKKNDDTLSATFQTDFELPPLAAPAPATAQPAVAPTPQPVAQPAPQPVAQPQPTPQPVAQPAPVAQATQPTATVTEGAQTEVRPRRRIAGTRPSISSVSINSILSDTPSPRATTTESNETVEVVIDKASQEKLLAARDKILAAIKLKHPRHLSVFENMVVEQNTITVKVPSRDQGEELSRSHIELGRELATIAEVNGIVKLEVVIDEHIRADRPIKIEDRLRHMTAKNERLIEMMERLNLDAE
ncbi:MAG: DNA polymerase III subunit gamma/tau [Alistipes sp.]|nr:DNA polymerase III subunit gamma/tau [Alistipes sp.]